MKTTATAAILAVSLGATAGGAAQAEIVWHFPYKSAPYATETAPTVRDYRAGRHHYRCRYFRRRAGEKPSLEKICR